MGRNLTRGLAAAEEDFGALRLWTYLSVLISVLAITAHEDFGALRLTIPLSITAGFLISWLRRRRRNTWLKALLAVGCLAAGWRFLSDVTQDPLHTSVPLTVFLLWLQTLHSFDLPRRRDLLFSLLSSVVLMAVAAVFTLDLLFAAYFAPYALAACVALVYNAYEAHARGADRPGGIRGGPLLAARLAGGEVLAAGGRLLFGLVLVAILVFLVTPRFPGLLISALPFSPGIPLSERLRGSIVNPAYPQGTEDATRFNPTGYFGFGLTVDLRLRGRLNDSVVMRVRTRERRNWRALVFDTYTGSGWTMADQDVVEYFAAIPPIDLGHGRDDVYAVRGRRILQTFYIEREQPSVAFAAPRPEQIYLPGDTAYVDRYSSVRLPYTLKPGMIYSVVSRPIEPAPGVLERAGEKYPWFIPERYLQLPAAVPARVRALARTVTAKAATPHERVLAVNRFLWQNYQYDLSIGPQRRPGDAVDYFLFDERRGYCEQFASAMVVLLRAAGVPARVVTGYTPGTYHPLTGFLEIRNSDAHAWVEAFYPGVGWVEYEPTPSFPDPQALGGPAAPRWVWQSVTEFLRARFPTVVAAGGLVRAARLAGDILPWLLLMTAALGAALLASRRVLRPAAPPGPETHILDAYAAFCRFLSSRGIRRFPTETAREFAARSAPAAPGPTAAGLTALVEKALYGPERASPADAREARRLLRTLTAPRS